MYEAIAVTPAPAPGAADAPQQAAGTVRGKVSYLAQSDSKPAIFIDPDGTRHVREDVRYETRTVRVRNGRPAADGFTLDRNGVRLARQRTAVADFYDDDEVAAVYFPEVERLIKQETGAAEVVIFDHTRRISGGEDGPIRRPVPNVHGDYTTRSGPQRVRDLIDPDRQAAWQEGRFAVINVWRPIRSPVERAPLAFVDGRTVAVEDFVAMDLVYPDRKGEIYGFTHNPEHDWVYFPRMTRDEALLIKTYDSADDGRVRFSAHAAIDDPATPADAPPRESIEIRALVRFSKD